MEKFSETMDQSVRELAAEQRRSLGEHLEIEALTAYHRGELSDDAREDVQDHLTLCEECSSLLLDLANFSDLEPPSEDYRLSTADVVAQKAALKALTDREEESGATVLAFSARAEETPPLRVVSAIPAWYHGVAAALLAVAVGLGIWGVSLRQQLAATAPMGSNPRFETLLPLDDLRRGGPPPAGLSAASQNDLVLQLSYLGDESYKEFRVEIVDAVGGFLWGSDGFKPSRQGGVTLAFPRELRAAGVFRIKLLGLGAGEPEILAEYELRLF